MPTASDNNPSSLDAEAADWLVELRDPENDSVGAESHVASREAAFLQWVGQSPQHLHAFVNSSRTFDALDRLAGMKHIDVRELINGHSNDVIPLYPSAEYVKEGPFRQALRRFPVWGAVALAAGLSALAVGIPILWTKLHPQEYVTAIGEQRTIQLDDGSVMHLNTDSRVQIHFTPQARQIDLLKGEALFEVTHSATQPFIVSAGTTVIRDLGTRFDVYKHDDASTTVAVVDGAVEVDNTRLSAGEEASVASGQVMKKPTPDVKRALAWRDRTLSFSGATLADVASEFNRYNKVQIHIEGDAVRERHLSGVFSADHPQSVILFLAKDESLSVIPEGDSWTVRAR